MGALAPEKGETKMPRYRVDLLGYLWWPMWALAATSRDFVKNYKDNDIPDDPDEIIIGEDGDFSRIVDYRLINLDTGEVLKDWESEEHFTLWVDCMYGEE